MKKTLAFDDVLMVPQYSEIESRKDIDIGSELHLGKKLDLPVISSPMDTITEDAMAVMMDENGGLGIIHRYNTIEEQSRLVELAAKYAMNVGAAIGVKGDYLERANALVGAGANVLCIDVAHGHHILMRRALESLRHFKEQKQIHIVAGNVATAEGYLKLAEWGASSVRVGIGGGSICSTRVQTGHGVSNLSAIRECYAVSNTLRPESRPKIIIDGGVQNAGDIVKALAAGADFVMCGSLLAGTDETPGETSSDGTQKVYRGMASREAQLTRNSAPSSPEGISTMVPCKGTVANILRDIAGNVRSGFSYSGARNIKELRERAEFVQQSTASRDESFTHILRRQ